MIDIEMFISVETNNVHFMFPWTLHVPDIELIRPISSNNLIPRSNQHHV